MNFSFIWLGTEITLFSQIAEKHNTDSEVKKNFTFWDQIRIAHERALQKDQIKNNPEDACSREFKIEIGRALFDISTVAELQAKDNFFQIACWPTKCIDMIGQIRAKVMAGVMIEGKKKSSSKKELEGKRASTIRLQRDREPTACKNYLLHHFHYLLFFNHSFFFKQPTLLA